ncbi:MAG: ribokinase [Chloroflexota bacterium]|nr:ribokinase [Chloroflexota bacterium]
MTQARQTIPKIFFVGSYNEGLTIRVPRMPALGESLPGDSFDTGPGGKGSNQAIAAARLGAQVSLLACVGDDIFADRALQLYAKEGIAADKVHRLPGAHTGIGFVNVLPDGENWITVDLGANLLMTADHARDCEALIRESDIVMAQFEAPPAPVAEAMALGKAHGKLTICNPAPARSVDPAMFADVDILTPNATEARILLGLPPGDPSPTEALARRLLDSGAGTVIVTLGERGALIVSRDGATHIPALAIDAVDVTGAGDSFNAALAVFLGEGLSIEAAVRRAVVSGAYTATRLGVIDGLPTRAEYQRFAAATR